MFSETSGAARLAGWQRQEQLKPASFISFAGSFGPIDEEEPPEEGEEEEDEEANEGDAMVAKMRRARAKLEAEMNKWKALIQIDILSKPEGASSERQPFLDQQKKLAYPIDDIQPADILDYVNSKRGSEDHDEMAASCAWLLLDIDDDCSDEEASALMVVAKNFFASIPHDYRGDVYDSVFVEVVKIDGSTKPPPKDEDENEGGGEDTGDGADDREDEMDMDGQEENIGGQNGDLINTEGVAPDKNGRGGAPSGAPRRAVFIALTCKVDHFRVYEERIPPGLLMTRAVRHFLFKVELKSTLGEIYEKSLPYEDYEERLFGPQEDELGEDGMNPIRFAKLCKDRMKAASDTIANTEKMNIDEINMHLKMRGLHQGGTIADKRDRLQRALQRQIDIMGFGELSSFGAEMVETIFKIYDKDCDEGFSLWELNQWLFDLGTETIIDVKDYQHLMEELELAVDENGYVTLDGITNYYERFGRLAEDLRRLGIGGLQELLHGQYEIQCDYESHAFQSFIDILEQHTASFVALKDTLKNLSSLKDFLFEGTYAQLGDIPYLQRFPWLQEAIRTPGWISKQIHTMAEILADGDTGIIRSMKMNAVDTFGTFGSFDSKFSQLFNVKKDKKGKGGAKDKETSNDGPQAKKGHSIVEELLKDVLPPLEPSEGLKESVSRSMREATRLRNYLRNNALLTRTEKEEAREKLHKAELEIESGIKLLDTCVQAATAHASAFYDAIRLYSKGVASVGYGFKELFGRVTMKGIDFVKYLPRALGEPSLLRFRREDRVRRAMERKKAAFSAMERERARRNMTDEDRERQKKERAERAQARRDEEEKTLFNEAYIGLTQAREEAKGESFIRKMLESWRKLALMREQRYPNTVKSAVTSNNYAVALKEFGHIDPAFIAEAVQWGTKAATSCQKTLADFNASFDMETMKASEASEAFVNKGKKVVGWVLIMQNFITLLRDTVNVSALRKHIDVRVTIWRLHSRLTKKEIHLLNAERKVENMITLPHGDVKSNMDLTISEVIEHNEELRREDEEAARLAGVVDDKTKSEDTDEDSSVSASVDEKTGISALDPAYLELMQRKERARKEKERRKQREKEKKLRAEAIKSRNKLYEMIKSDEITKFFSDRAENPALADEELPWLKPAPPPGEDDVGSVISAVTNHFGQDGDSQDRNMYEYSGELPNAGGIHPSSASVESMSQISNVSDFAFKQQNLDGNNSLDGVSMLDSIAEYQNLDDPTATGGEGDDITLGSSSSPQKKGIFGWLFRSRGH